ncbi:pseudouridine synthase [Mycoplasma sp. Ms02]|uniref:pseudouridine synthase n=1 Tax=Mycoplasma sp. Ms02 TaxID=353851 RepID=UPI001C88F7B6|nr:pseudouridine synthase [Mycoplasma sp. Ms02]QZE12401.1 pseudouridine synthase [Mycoplasma sp. Ms02]
MVRIEKLISLKTRLSRTEIKKKIAQGFVLVNDLKAKHGQKVNFGDKLIIDNQEIDTNEFSYYVFNKPLGLVCSHEDKYNQTIYDYLDFLPKNVQSFGRLDKDTSGLLILSDDTKLLHELLNPKKHVKKTYYVKTDKEIKLEDLESFCNQGVNINNEYIAKAIAFETLSSNECYLTIDQGKYHQVRRMFKAKNLKVIKLERTNFANLSLQNLNLKAGEWRRLESFEILALKEKRTNH